MKGFEDTIMVYNVICERKWCWKHIIKCFNLFKNKSQQKYDTLNQYRTKILIRKTKPLPIDENRRSSVSIVAYNQLKVRRSKKRIHLYLWNSTFSRLTTGRARLHPLQGDLGKPGDFVFSFHRLARKWQITAKGIDKRRCPGPYVTRRPLQGGGRRC